MRSTWIWTFGDCATRQKRHMPIPDADRAVVAQEKVQDYLLNTAHPVGGPKAVWFTSIGYQSETWEELADDLLHLVRTSDEFAVKPSPYGVKYEVAGEIGRAGHRPGRVVSVWIVEGNNPPRLVTAYPE